MRVITTIQEIQQVVEQKRCSGQRIAVVPTMGFLHQGHASLITRARSEADVVITTIFVNPTQFGPAEDYDRYPRNFNRDVLIAEQAGCDMIFHPEVKEMYPQGMSIYVEVEGVTNILEGKIRPEHFRGVTTIVAKLLQCTKPHVAIFGQKDAQQAFVVRKMIQDLNFDVRLIVAPIVRETDGLALSSRNIYLNEAERKNALVLYQSLLYASQCIREGQRDFQLVKQEMKRIVNSGSPTHIDYIASIDPATFREIENPVGSELLMALAVRFGSTRLIDNMIISVHEKES